MSVSRTIARNTVLTLVGRFAFIVVWIFLTPIALTRLGREAFGFWSILLFLGGSFAFFDLGLSTATTRYAAQLGAVNAWEAIASMVRRALLLCAAFGAVISVIGILATPYVLAAFHVPPAWRDQAALAFALAFACLAMTTIVGVLQGALNGLQRMDLTNAIGLALVPVLVLLVLGALALRAPLVALVAAQAIHVTLASLVLAVVLKRIIARRRRARTATDDAVASPGLGEMVRFGTQVQVGMVTGLLHMHVDKILIGTLVGLTWVAPYELGLRAANALGGLPQVFLHALMPALADIDARHSGARRADLYVTVLEPYILLLVPLCVGTALLADPLLQLWLGEPKPDAAFALRMLVASLGLTLVSGVAATLARAGGRPELEARFGMIALSIHVPLSLAGLKILGWQGALLGSVIASMVASIWLLGVSGAWLGLPPFRAALKALASAGCPAALASITTWTVLRLWPPAAGRTVALLVLASGALTFLLTYVAVAVVAFPVPARRFANRIRAALPS